MNNKSSRKYNNSDKGKQRTRTYQQSEKGREAQRRQRKRNQDPRRIAIRKNLGSYIQKLRQERGLKKQDFAEKLGVSAYAVSSWEIGYSVPKQDIVDKMYDVLELDKSDARLSDLYMQTKVSLKELK